MSSNQIDLFNYIDTIFKSDRNPQRKLDIIESAMAVLNRRLSEIPKIGDVVYHQDVFDGLESLKIVGIRANELELEGVMYTKKI